MANKQKVPKNENASLSWIWLMKGRCFTGREHLKWVLYSKQDLWKNVTNASQKLNNQL